MEGVLNSGFARVRVDVVDTYPISCESAATRFVLNAIKRPQCEPCRFVLAALLSFH